MCVCERERETMEGGESRGGWEPICLPAFRVWGSGFRVQVQDSRFRRIARGMGADLPPCAASCGVESSDYSKSV